ncbi:hypothetical protein [Lacticaseibacillus sp. 866-1]|uniref:hypothetical protein n=2 Tax=unclassified Lacticaseibacillus TaxID=2759744 RepID=UPI001940D912|nr:hypothetical protein [Lacticaseibacillus sp. 866-1]
MPKVTEIKSSHEVPDTAQLSSPHNMGCKKTTSGRLLLNMILFDLGDDTMAKKNKAIIIVEVDSVTKTRARKAADLLDEATTRAHDEISCGEYDSFDSVDDWYKNLTNEK